MLDAEVLARLLHLLPQLDELYISDVLLRPSVSIPIPISRPLRRLTLAPFTDDKYSEFTLKHRVHFASAAVAPLALFSSIEQLTVKKLGLRWDLDVPLTFP